ncbi:MAG: response regulator, partial [Deltaproteobacteria bacterium]|nr:response regulator [Deltaproteobacteria bacterium]
EGYVTVQSDPGEGTVFEVFFPLVGEVVVPEEKEEEITTYPGGTETILMVDDEETILILSKAMLSAYGYKVITSPDGQSALDTYRSTTEIDLVILDLNMPRMSGIECLQGLLKIDPSVKVIICSGYAPEKLTSEIVGDYAIEFLTKPFDIKTLLRTVREALDSS